MPAITQLFNQQNNSPFSCSVMENAGTEVKMPKLWQETLAISLSVGYQQDIVASFLVYLS
jgi:hypothetical protein